MIFHICVTRLIVNFAVFTHCLFSVISQGSVANAFTYDAYDGYDNGDDGNNLVYAMGVVENPKPKSEQICSVHNAKLCASGFLTDWLPLSKPLYDLLSSMPEQYLLNMTLASIKDIGFMPLAYVSAAEWGNFNQTKACR